MIEAARQGFYTPGESRVRTPVLHLCWHLRNVGLREESDRIYNSIGKEET